MKNFFLLLLAFAMRSEVRHSETPDIHFDGLQVAVHDLSEAKHFYHNLLGFELTEDNKIQLQAGHFPIQLVEVSEKNPARYHQHARVSLTLQVDQLLPAIDRLRKRGVKFHEQDLQRNGVGISIPFRDPSGNLLSLMEVQVGNIQSFEGIRVYNTGITSADMKKARAFYQGILGFLDWSTAYLPAAMPLKNVDGSFAYMLHQKSGLVPKTSPDINRSRMSLAFSTSNLQAALDHLKNNNVSIVEKDDDLKHLIFQDPFGNFCVLREK